MHGLGYENQYNWKKLFKSKRRGGKKASTQREDFWYFNYYLLHINDNIFWDSSDKRNWFFYNKIQYIGDVVFLWFLDFLDYYSDFGINLESKALSRIVDTFGGIIFATISLAIILIIFPFNFSHIADVLPDFLRFIIGWISNDIAKVIIIILIILHLAAAIYSPLAYKFVDKKIFCEK